MSWGKRIATARIAAALSQAELGDLLHASQQTVAAWETEVNEPRLATFEAIAKVTGTAPEWLAFGVGRGPKAREA